MRSRLRLGDLLLAAFAVLLVLAVVHRAQHVQAQAHTHKVVHVQAQVYHRKA